MEEASLYDGTGNVRVILGLPSLDTSTCAAETRRFNQEAAALEGVEVLVVSKDLPFAMSRFCETEGIDQVEVISDFRYSDFSEEYSSDMTEGKLKGLFARTLFVVDADNVIRYREIVSDIVNEPDYAQALEAIKAISEPVISH